MGSAAGVRKKVAAELGMTLEEYEARCVAEKWCTGCKAWHERDLDVFGADSSRSDGLSASCLASRRVVTRQPWRPHPNPLTGKPGQAPKGFVPGVGVPVKQRGPRTRRPRPPLASFRERDDACGCEFAEWRPVDGWDGYEVSDHGQVRSRRQRTPRIMRPMSMPSGHQYVIIARTQARGEKRRKRWVHHLVLEAFVGPCPPGYETRHLSDDARDNHLTNLCWGTRLENAGDRLRLGSTPRGEDTFMAVLTEEDVREILADTTRGVREMARFYGVSHAAIRRVQLKETWTHVSEDGRTAHRG